MQARRYESADQPIWDDFVAKARNRHFFFFRNYMDYHKDRFTDASLLFFDDKNQLKGVLPASINGEIAVSHGGLTFGGVIDNDMTMEQMLGTFETMREIFRSMGCYSLMYKCMPYIYMRYPSEEDRYALFRHGAKLVRRDISATIYLPERVKYSKLRKRMVKKSQKESIMVEDSTDFADYFSLVDEVLFKRHGVHPVHTAEEMELLAGRFSQNIKLYIAKKDEELLAGVLLFLNDGVVHTQYLACSDRGGVVGALDGVIDFLIEKYGSLDYRYFDFGISNEQQGRVLNEGLIRQKEGFGGRGAVHDFYELEL